jgi:hypothetical protein
MTKQNRTIEASADLFDGQGSIATRISKLRHLQSLGFVDKKFNFPRIAADPGALKTVEDFALAEARTASKTSGVLIRSTEGGDNPRVHMQITTYEGDPAACWDLFKAPGFTATINKDVGTHQETATIQDGETLVVLRRDGTIAHLDGTEIARAGKETSNGEKHTKSHSEVKEDPRRQELLAKQYRKDIDELKNQERPLWTN